MKIIHLFKESNQFPPEYQKDLELLGELTIFEHCADWDRERILKTIGDTDILVTSHQTVPVPREIADNPGRLKYINHLHGTIRKCIPREVVAAGIPVSNWGPGPSYNVAKAAMTLLLTMISDLPTRIDHVRNGGWMDDLPPMPLGYLQECRVGIYGLGVIGRKFVDMLRPFECPMTVFDPFVEDLPEDCVRSGSLRELCAHSDILVIHAGLSDETRGSVNGEMLDLLPLKGIVINTARGDIINQEDLFERVEGGRLRAGLDVLEHGPDGLDAPFDRNHPIRQNPDCLLTCHRLSKEGEFRKPRLRLNERISLENIRAFIEGKPLKYAYDTVRYDRST